MNGQYITDYITSVEAMNKVFESLIQGSSFDFRALNDDFYTKGEGIATHNFFIGNFITSNLESINISNLGHLIITMPQKGQFSFHSGDKKIINKARKTGTMVCGVDEAVYNEAIDTVHDFVIIIDYNELVNMLDKKFGLQSFQGRVRSLDQNNNKVNALFNYINSTLQLIQTYSSIQDSLVAKMNMKQITLLMTTDLIGDLFHKKNVLNNSTDKKLVFLAEEIMESQYENITTIQEVADKVFTSPRNLQKAFKKHRDYTPLQFLKEQKLQRANQMLQDPYLSASIKNVAISVGIFDINRFGKYYFDRFGEYPNETLKKKVKI